MNGSQVKSNWLVRNRQIIIYGISLGLLMLLLNFLQLRFVFMNHAYELYVGAVAIIFTGLGIWLALRLTKPKVMVETRVVEVEKEIRVRADDFVLNEKELEKLGISRRELEVLELMGQGLSNQEIAGKLFVSLNTIKTHSSNLFVKLDVKRRTQAVEKAKKTGLIP